MERISMEEVIRCILFNYPEPTEVTASSKALQHIRKLQEVGEVQEVGTLKFLPTNFGLVEWGVTIEDRV